MSDAPVSTGLADSFKAALWTALFTFVGTAGTALIGLLDAVGRFVQGDDYTLVDDWSVFSKIIVSAAIAGVSGLVNWVVRAAQSKGVLPGRGPSYGG